MALRTTTLNVPFRGASYCTGARASALSDAATEAATSRTLTAGGGGGGVAGGAITSRNLMAATM